MSELSASDASMKVQAVTQETKPEKVDLGGEAFSASLPTVEFLNSLVEFENIEANSIGAKDFSISLAANNGQQIGKIVLKGLSSQLASASLISDLIQENEDKSATVISSESLAKLLNNALAAEARISSDLGRTPEQIANSYSQNLLLQQEKSATFSEIKLANDASFRWFDLNLTIPDKTAQADELAKELAKHLPKDANFNGVSHTGNDSGAVFVHVPFFKVSENHDCELTKRKVFCFAGPNLFVTIHDGETDLLTEITKSMATSAIETKGASAFGLVANTLERALTEAEQTLDRFDSVYSELKSDLRRRGKLSSHQLSGDVLSLLESSDYIQRKMGDVERGLGHLEKALSRNDGQQLIGEMSKEAASDKLSSLLEMTQYLQRKAESLEERVDRLAERSDGRTEIESSTSQKRMALLQLVTLPPLAAWGMLQAYHSVPHQEFWTIGVAGGVIGAGLVLAAARKKIL